MSLFEIIQGIPAFISEQIKASKEGSLVTNTIGKFHLGLQYDMNIWQGSSDPEQQQTCAVFPCKEEKESAPPGGPKRKGYIDVYTVITESLLLYLEPDHKVKNVARLIAWFTLPALETVKRNMENATSITFTWRKLEDSGEHKPEFKLVMQNSADCVALLMKNLKNLGIGVSKVYEKKRKILESEVSSEAATKGINIDDLHAIITQQEALLATDPSKNLVDNLMELYNKAIVYYSALSDEKHLEYLQKLQRLFSDDKVQSMINPTAPSQSNEQEESKIEEEQVPE